MKSTDEEIKKMLKIINDGVKKICANPNCKKEFNLKKNSQKYCCPECGKIVRNANARIQQKKRYENMTDEQREINRFKNMVKCQLKNPTCMFQQQRMCVKKAFIVDGVKIFNNKRSSECPFLENKEKCPEFKPKYPEIYKNARKQIIKMENKND